MDKGMCVFVRVSDLWAGVGFDGGIRVQKWQYLPCGRSDGKTHWGHCIMLR